MRRTEFKKTDPTLVIIIIITLFALLAAIFIADMCVRKAGAAEWDNWNVAPFAHSQKEAFGKAFVSIDGFDWSAEEKTLAKKTLAHEKGVEVWLTPDMQIEQMWSGGSRPHVMNRVTVGELPVLESPDGRPYRKGAVAEAAKALSWSWEYEGKAYVLYLPFVCFNWCWGFGDLPSESCVEISFSAPIGGKVRWGIGTANGDFIPPSACGAQRQGDGPWTAWGGQCDECVGAVDFIRGILGAKADIPHRFLYSVTEALQTFRFSSNIETCVVGICLEYPDGKRTCGVYVRPQDWDWRRVIKIPDSFWKSDAECPE